MEFNVKALIALLVTVIIIFILFRYRSKNESKNPPINFYGTSTQKAKLKTQFEKIESMTMKIRHNAETSDHWSGWDKFGYKQHYRVFDLQVKIPRDGQKDQITEVVCPICDAKLRIYARSNRSCENYSVFSLMIFGIINIILWLVDAGMLSVFLIFFGIFLGGSIFIKSKYKIEESLKGSHEIHVFEVFN